MKAGSIAETIGAAHIAFRTLTNNEMATKSPRTASLMNQRGDSAKKSKDIIFKQKKRMLKSKNNQFVGVLGTNALFVFVLVVDFWLLLVFHSSFSSHTFKI